MSRAQTFRRLWDELAPIGRTEAGGYRRFAWTSEDAQLRAWFATQCERLGLAYSEDRAGNQWGWWVVGDDGTPGVATGSHLDSVPDGGAFDGPLGVVSALIAIEELQQRGFTPRVPLGVVNFVDEEGARFGVACAGSRVLTGVLTPERALALRDDAGVSLAEALRTVGAAPIGPDPDALARVGCYVELHVEQGRGLVDLGRPVAVATGIWPHGRWRIDLPGRADHAGTTRLEDRSDALVSFAAVVLEARWVAAKNDCVATIGKVQVTPGGVNAIPSHVTTWLDARGAEEAAVHELIDQVSARITELGGQIVNESWTPLTPFDEVLRDRLAVLLDAPLLGTAAGHDAGILANAGVPSAMLFVRNPDGTSHSPSEHAEEADCLAGIGALVAVLEELAG